MTLAPTASLFLLSIATGAGGEGPEWSGFRGTNGAGVAEAGAIPDALDPEASALWRVELPGGYSSPIVAGERVFVTAAEGERLLTVALDRVTGEELWMRELAFDGVRVGANSSAAPTPVTDGERVYALFHAAGLVAYDAADGEELWRHEIEPPNIPHGLATSPVLCDDALVLVVDQDGDAYVAALDKRTGEPRWRVDRPGVTHGYATPTVHRPASGAPQVIVSGSLQVRAYSVADGEELWRVDGSAWQTKGVPVVAGERCFVNAAMLPSSELGIPEPAESFEAELEHRDADGDGRISRDEWPGSEMLHQAWFIFDLDDDGLLDEEDWTYLGRSRRAGGGLFAIDLGGEGDVTESHVAWRYDDRRGLPDCPSPLVLGGLLWLVKDGGILTAIDAESGEVVEQGRVGGSDRYFASPVGAGDRVVTASLGGQLAVVQVAPERDGWEVLSVSDLGEELWSTPAIVGDRVYVRTQSALWCFGALEEAAAGEEAPTIPW